MRTIQGKEFNLNDILLCDIKDYDIVLLVNDMEQLSKYEKVRFTKRAPKNLPIGKIFYSKENLLKIIKGMKKIESYVELPNDAIEVTYLDGTKIIYDASEKSAILKNIEAQKEISKTSAVGNWMGENNVVVANWFDEKEEEHEVLVTKEATKEEKSNKNSNKTNRIIAGILAAALIVGSAFYLGRKARTKLNDDEASYVNGVYPTSMEEMNKEEADKKAREILDSLNAIIATNLNPNTRESDMLDFASYIETTQERTLVNNVMNVAREVVVASSKSEKEYNAAIEKYLNYQFDTINSPEFLTMPSGTRYLITGIFCEANNTIPKESFVTRQKSEMDVREYDLYYRYFSNNFEGRVYLPERYKNELIYVYTDQYCHREVYTEEQMLAMAGMLPVADQISLGIMADANVEEMGIKPETELRRVEAEQEFLSLKDVYILKK